MKDNNSSNNSNQGNTNPSNQTTPSIQAKPPFIQKPIIMTMLDNSAPKDRIETKPIKP